MCTYRYNLIFILLFTLSLFGCGGGGGSSNPPPNNPPPSGGNGVSVSGKVVYGDSHTALAAKTMKVYSSKVQNSGFSKIDYLTEILDLCHVEYQEMWSELTPNDNGLNVTRTITVETVEYTFIALNIDTDLTGSADLNVEVSNVPDMPFIDYINFDVNCNGTPDINIDNNGDGVPELNIDENGDGIGDYDIVDASLTTVEGATVSLYSEGGTLESESTTGQDGIFNITDIETGGYELVITKELDGNIIVWNRSQVSISEDGADLGIYPLDAGPHIERANFNTQPVEAAYGSRYFSNEAEQAFNIGTTMTWEVYVIDPNADQVSANFSASDELGNQYTESVDGTPVAGESGVFKFTVTVTIQNDHYELDVGSFSRQLIPDTVAGLNMAVERPDCEGLRYELCDPGTPVMFDWNDVSGIDFVFGVLNGDGVGSLNGFEDISVELGVDNSSYDYQPDTSKPQVNSVVVNGTTYTNSSPESNFTVDLGNISGEVTLDIEINAVADEAYPIGYRWNFPDVFDSYDPTVGDVIINVADFPKVYPSDDAVTRMELTIQYRDSTQVYSVASVKVRFNYNVAGTAEPAECTDISVNGNGGDNSDTIYFKGQTLALQAIANDPNGLPIEVAFRRNSVDYEDSFITGFIAGEIQYVPVTDVVNYTLKTEDVTDDFTLIVYCRNNDGIGLSSEDSEDSIHNEGLIVSQ